MDKIINFVSISEILALKNHLRSALKCENGPVNKCNKWLCFGGCLIHSLCFQVISIETYGKCNIVWVKSDITSNSPFMVNTFKDKLSN